MVIAGLFLYTLGKYLYKISISLIFPAIAIAYISYSYMNAGGVDNQMMVGTLGHINFFRGMAEMCIGILLFELNQNTNLFKKNAMQFVGVFCLLFVIVMSFRYGQECDYLYIFLISIGIITGFNTPLWFGKKSVAFFEGISYSIYLNHLIFFDYIMPACMPELSWQALLIYVISVTVFAIFMHFFTNTVVSMVYKKLNLISN